MNRLKERRQELGLTQEAVSNVLKIADPRMDVSMVSRFENGVCLPTEEVMTALEAVLRTDRGYLYGDEEKARKLFDRYRKCTKVYCECFEKGYSLETPVLVTNADDYADVIEMASGSVKAGAPLLTALK